MSRPDPMPPAESQGNGAGSDPTAVPSSAAAAPSTDGGAAVASASATAAAPDGDRARDRADAGALEREAELASGTESARLLLGLAELRVRLGDDDGALAALEKARTIDPDSAPVLASLRRLALRTWRWPLAADVLAAERKHRGGLDRVGLSLELSDVLAERLGRRQEALALLLEILESDPANARALSRAIPMWTESSAWTEQAEGLAAAAEACLAEDPRRASALFYEAAEVFRWRLHAPERALEMLGQAVKADVTGGVAAKALAEVASEQRDWAALATALEIEAAMAARPELAAAALVKLGAVREDLLSDPEGAEKAYRAALEKEPANRTALVALSRMAEAKGDDALRAELLERRLLLATDVREAIATSLALGTLYEERLGSKDRAANHFQRVLAVTADEAPAFRALGRLMASTGDWRGLLLLYEREAAETPDPSHKVHCLFKIAELYEDRLGEDGSAIAAYRRVLEVSPTYLPALRALGRLFQRASDWPSLIDLYRGEAAATTDDAHAISLLERVADLEEEKLEDAEAAAKTWEEILTRAPEHLPALRALGRLLFRREQWARLVEVNLREAALTREPRVVAALLQKTGEVYEEKLSLAEDALRCYREALEHVPNYLPAMRSLGRLAAARDAWAEVIRTEEMEAELTADPRRAASLLASAAEHYETKLNDPEKAIVAYEKVLSRVPQYLPAVAGLSRLYRRAGRWRELVRILEGAIPPSDRDAGAAAAFLVEIANIEGHRLGEDGQAAQRLATARAGAPADLTARREHEEYLAKSAAWMELAGIYAADAESDAPGAFRAALYVRLGDLAQKVAGAPDGGVATAAGFYRAALALEPGNRAAAAGLESVALRSGDERMRIEALTATSLAASSLAERRALMIELARLSERGGDLASAAACWSAAVAIEPDLDSLEAQARVARRAGNFAAAADALAAAVPLAPDGAERERVAIEAAEAFSSNGQWERAEALLAPLAAGDGETAAALVALERLHLAHASADPATSLDALARAVDAEKKLAARTRDPARKTELMLRAAETLIGPLGQPGEAAGLLEQVASTEPTGSAPHASALALLEKLHAATGDAVGQASILERRAESVQGEERFQLLLEAGRLLRPRDPDRAILLLERAATAFPTGAMPALNALVEAYAARENWQPLLTTWNRVISLTRDPAVAADAFHQKGVILAERLSLADKAEQHFQRALAADPKHRASLERLFALQDAAGRAAEARATLTRLIALLPVDDPARTRLLVREAELAGTAGDDGAALAALKGIAEKEPGNLDVILRIVDLLAKKGDAAGQLPWIRNALSAAPEAERPAIRAKLAAALAAAGDEQGAALEWRTIVRAQPENVDARKSLATLLAARPGNRGEAIPAHASVLKLDPTASESLAWLAKSFGELKHHDKVLCLCGVLCWIGAASTEQKIFYEDQIAKAPRRAKEPVSIEDRRGLLLHPDARGEVGDFVLALGSGLWAGLPVDVPAGATKVDLDDKSHPLRARLDSLRSLFGGAEIEAFVTREPGAEAKVVVGDPMQIFVGMGFPALPAPVQDFLLARAVFRCVTGFPPAWRSEHELRADIWTAAAALDFTDPPMGSDPKRIKAIAKAVSRKQKKDVAEFLAGWVAHPQSYDVAKFVGGARRSADRAGLLACPEIAKAIDALSFVEPDVQALRADESNAEPFWTRAARIPSVREMLAFASSDEIFTLRKKTGLAIFSQ